PVVGVSRQPIMFIKVDLPLPEGPMTATYSFRRTRRSTPFSARTVVSPMRYSFVICSIRITAGPLRRAFSGDSSISLSIRIFRSLYFHSRTFLQILAKRRIGTANNFVIRSDSGPDFHMIVVCDPGLHGHKLHFVSLFSENDPLELLHSLLLQFC